jgi:hypothetical protein
LVKITYSPISEIIIHEMVEYSLSDFVKLMTDNIPPGNISPSVKWCDQIVFMSTGLPSTADVVKDQMNGIVHWAWFAFAEMPSYKATVETSSKVVLPVIDVSNNELNKDLIKWIKSNKVIREMATTQAG